MAYQIHWDEKARDFLRTISKEEAQRIIRKVNAIVDFPWHYLDRLEEVKAYKLRVGDYRLIIDLDENTQIVSVLFIGHRKNVYDRL